MEILQNMFNAIIGNSAALFTMLMALGLWLTKAIYFFSQKPE